MGELFMAAEGRLEARALQLQDLLTRFLFGNNIQFKRFTSLSLTEVLHIRG
jgi:hypothetical protein